MRGKTDVSVGVCGWSNVPTDVLSSTHSVYSVLLGLMQPINQYTKAHDHGPAPNDFWNGILEIFHIGKFLCELMGI